MVFIYRKAPFLKTENMFKHWKIIIFGTGMTLYILGLFTNVVADPDLWGYLAFGRLFWESGYFPYHDVFSYIPTKELWVYHEWLTGVLFYPVYKWTGETGLQLLRYAIILMTVSLVFFTAKKRGSKPIPTIIILFLTVNALTYGYSPVRAQVFTYLFFALSIYILERCKKEQTFALLWWLLPVYLIWCNVHGGFLAGLGILGLYAIGERLSGRRALPYILILIASSMITLINPYGIDYWLYTINAVSMPRQDIIEWMSIPTAMKSGKFIEAGILFMSFFIISALLIIRYGRHNFTDILVLAVTAYLGFRHIRHSIFFFLAFGAYIPIILSDFLNTLKPTAERYQKRSAFARHSLPFLIFLFALLSLSSFVKFMYTPSLSLLTPPPYYPVGALQWINAHQWKGNILPHFDWGEFIIWECYPDCRVAMDGRFETVYREDDHREYFDFLMGRNDWGRFLNKYPHDMVLIRSNSKTDALMRSHPDWQLVYEDTGCSLFLPKMRGSAR
jgi:hypothetical protein